MNTDTALQLTEAATTIMRPGKPMSDTEIAFRAHAFQHVCQMFHHADNLATSVKWTIEELWANQILRNDQRIAADVILGMAKAIPTKNIYMMQEILNNSSHFEGNIEGIVTGLFETCSIGESSFDAELALFIALAVGNIPAQLCDTKSTNSMRGRLSSALKQFITPAWKNGSHLGYRLTLISALTMRFASLMRVGNIGEPKQHAYFIGNKPGYNIPGPTTPMTCMELLCEEMTNRFLLESGLSFRMGIIGNARFDVSADCALDVIKFRESMKSLG